MSPATHDRPTDEIRHLDLWALCIWAYRDQRAASALFNTSRVFAWMIGEADSDYIDAGTPRLHADAVAVHGAVLELSEDYAHRIIYAARRAERPEPSTMSPLPFPMPPKQGVRSSWFVRAGRRVPYLIAVCDRIGIMEPVLERRGRAKHVVVGEKVVNYDVECCPIEWSPDPAFLDFANDTYRCWLDAMRELLVRLDGVSLRKHRITGFAHTEAPTWDVPLYTDAAVAQAERDRAAQASVTVEQLQHRPGRARHVKDAA